MIKTSKILILTQTDPSDWAYNEWKNNGVRACIAYKPVNKFLRLIRRIWIRFHIPIEKIWYNNWAQDAINSSMVIVHISKTTLNIPEYINRINPKCKVIGWYWNSIVSGIEPSRIRGDVELWSFDPCDCAKYGLKFNHQYYFKSFVIDGNELETDVYFCGSDSGRGEYISRLYYKLQNMGLKVKMRVVNAQYKDIPKDICSSHVPYNQILDDLSRTKAIIEIVRKGQNGATIREMEALFYNKKLITNNKWILKEPYYNEQQFFLLGSRNDSELIPFLEKSLNCNSNKWVEKYDFVKWLHNFEDNN